MTLNEYINNLQTLVTLNPLAGQMPVVYAKDEEGNGFHALHSQPSIMSFESEDSYYLEPCEDDEDGFQAVCIN